MSMETVRIYRDFQVIDGLVQVPNNLETDRDRVTVTEALAAVSGSQQLYLSQGSGDCHGWRSGAQSTLRLPGLVPGTSYLTATGADPVDSMAGS